MIAPIRKPKKPAETPIYQFKITLLGFKPKIWRRFQVEGNITLYHFHSIIQVVMGWTDSHLHKFKIGGEVFRPRYPDGGMDLDFPDDKDEARFRLVEVFPKAKMKAAYDYDFGDGWEHELLLEKILPPDPRFKRPICLEGENACPPEDCGGIWGYAELLEAQANPKHERHEEIMEWLDEPYDPTDFPLEWINAALKRKRP